MQRFLQYRRGLPFCIMVGGGDDSRSMIKQTPNLHNAAERLTQRMYQMVPGTYRQAHGCAQDVHILGHDTRNGQAIVGDGRYQKPRGSALLERSKQKHIPALAVNSTTAGTRARAHAPDLVFSLHLEHLLAQRMRWP